MKILSDERGYSLIELVSVLVVTSIFVGLILTFTFHYWRYGSLMEADMDTLITRLNAGDTLRELLSSSSGLIIQNSLPDPNPHNPDPDDVTGEHWLPIHAIPGNTAVTASGTSPVIYFKRFSFDSSNNIIMNGIQPYENEYVLYIHHPSKELRLRTIANPSAPGNQLETSCPPESSTPTCPADKTIASDLSSIDTRYFSRTGNLVDYTSVFDTDTNEYIGPDFPVVEVAELKLNLTKKPFLQKTNATQNSTVIRVALRNK